MTDPGEWSVLEALPDGVVVADDEGDVVVVSSVAARMLGIEPEEAKGRPLWEVLALQHGDGGDWCAANMPYDGLATRTGVPEQSWLLPDGTEVLVVARIERPALDQPVSRLTISLRNGRARARLDRDRSDLVATVAHELRSPLTGVKGFVQAMLNRWDKLSDAQKKLMLTTVHADSERLSRLITELLDVARIDTGRLSLHPRPVDAATLLRRVAASVEVGTTRPIELDVPDDLPHVHADPDRLTQVFTNLVENAIRHGEGTVQVRATAQRPDQEFRDGSVRVVVEDEGEGIEPEMRRRVFTKFWTGGGSGGSGLGLYLVQGLVRAHGGEVHIHDREPRGASVVVDWPVSSF